MAIDAYEIRRCATVWPHAWMAAMKIQSIAVASIAPIHSFDANIRCNAFRHPMFATATRIVVIAATKWPIAAKNASNSRATTACASPATNCATESTIVEMAATKCIAHRNVATTNTTARPKDV